MFTKETITIFFGTIVRHGLTFAAGYLALVGATEAQRSGLVEALTPIVLSAIATAIAIVSSYVTKKFALEKVPEVS